METAPSSGKTTQHLLVEELTNSTYKQQIKDAWSNKDHPEEPTSAALPHLILLANNKTGAHSRLTAAQWLCRNNYGLPAAVTALIELAFDANPDVSKNALAQLEALDDPQAIKALKGLVKWGADQDMRSTARHYLLLKTGKQQALPQELEQEESKVSSDAENEEQAINELPVKPAVADASSRKVELLTTSSMLVVPELTADEAALSAPLPVATNVTASQPKVAIAEPATYDGAEKVQKDKTNSSPSEDISTARAASSSKALSERFLQLFRHDYQKPLWFPSLLLTLITTGELFFLLPDPVLGMGIHIAVLFILLYSLVYIPDRPVRRLNTVLLLVPILRMMSLGLPLAGLPQISWYALTSVPIFAAMALIARSKEDPWSWEELGLTARQWPIQLAVALTGIGIGWLEYWILAPEPLSTALTLQAIWLPALILLISTGFLEELLFRGLLQSAAIPVIGRWPALLFISALFAVLHIGYGSVIDVLFVFAIGLGFALVVERTRSILGVTIAHGLANISLYLIWPHLLM